MNPIEKDLKNYYGTSSDSDILEHYGTKRHSGRYPWGSGDNPYQHSGDFLSRVETLKKKGMSENEILDQINSTLPKEYQLGLTEFRVARRKAIHERKASEYEKIAALKEQGLGWKAIGEKLGMSESSVRSKYAGTADKKAQRAENIADTLKKEVDKKGMIDISEGANLVMGVSQSELDDAAYTLEAEYGYKRYGVGIRQPTNIRQQTNITVLAMAAQARKEAVNMKGIQRDPEAAKTYAAEVMSLKDKYTTMLANKPKERKAMLIANANIKAKIQELGLDPQNTEDKKEIKKISSVEMQRARDKVGASGQKSKVRFSDREWEAIQAGAISDNMLSKFLNSSDSDEIVKRAMPKTTASLSSAKLTKARAMLRSGYTYKEIAQACGVPESTVYDALGK